MMSENGSEKIEYEERLVAFIDILGFKSLVNASGNNADNILEVLNHITDLVSTHYKDHQIKGVKTTIFSDCVVISAPIDNIDNLFYAVLPLVWLQCELLYKFDILIRGGISKGMIYHDDKFVFGSALNEAYHLESESAKYPRIIVDKNIEEKFAEDLENLKQNQQKYKNLDSDYKEIFIKEPELIKKDDDGFFYINYLEVYHNELDEPHIDYTNFIDHTKNIIDKNKNSNIKEKYDWLAKEIARIAIVG